MAGRTIGAVACQAGVAASTLRYYEKVGLLPRPARAGNRRLYERLVAQKNAGYQRASGRNSKCAR
jgi:MerR family redox-sensitive transcriptional activator SoxR